MNFFASILFLSILLISSSIVVLATFNNHDVHAEVSSETTITKEARKEGGVQVKSKTTEVSSETTITKEGRKEGGVQVKSKTTINNEGQKGGAHGHNHHHHHKQGKHKDGDEIQIIKTKATEFPPMDKHDKPQVLHGDGHEGKTEVRATSTSKLAPPVDKSKIHVPILRNGAPQPDVEFTGGYLGMLKLKLSDVGVNAMQTQLMPNNKVVWFDTTTLGPSARFFPGVDPKNCPIISWETGKPDCYAHAIQFDYENGNVTPLKIEGDPWCSSGGLGPNGDLFGTGGNAKGNRTIRLLKPCDDCKFIEKHYALGAPRWYSTQQILENGNMIVVGGRYEFSYDLFPPTLDFKPQVFSLPFLKETQEQALHVDRVPYENNLYPFVYLVPDGNVFLFANNRSILFNPYNGKTIREYPQLAGGARNYPPSGMSALLPFKLDKANPDKVDAEVVVCGGNHPFAFGKVDKKHTNEKTFIPALQDCWRMKIHDQNPQWVREQDMPHRRTMADLLHLPTGDLLFINGAQKGTSGWEDSEEPNLIPVLYSPHKPMGQRFKELAPTTIARLYHSSSALLPGGHVLVAGSNPHQFYTFNGPYPTDMRVEFFYPPYTNPELEHLWTKINEEDSTKEFTYGQKLNICFSFTAAKPVEFSVGEIKVSMIAPPFTTHGFCQNQRMMFLAVEDVKVSTDHEHAAKGVTITALAPASGKIAPPGYYLLYVVYRGMPSHGVWVHIKS